MKTREISRFELTCPQACESLPSWKDGLKFQGVGSELSKPFLGFGRSSTSGRFSNQIKNWKKPPIKKGCCCVPSRLCALRCLFDSESICPAKLHPFQNPRAINFKSGKHTRIPGKAGLVVTQHMRLASRVFQYPAGSKKQKRHLCSNLCQGWFGAGLGWSGGRFRRLQQ